MTSISFDLGEDISVRSYVPDDAQALFELIEANREHLRPWMPWESETLTAQDTRNFIERSRAHETDIDGNGLWAVAELIGSIGITVDTESSSGDIGYWIAPTYEGHGIVTRACSRFFDFAFDDLGLHRMTLSAAVENTRSRAVAGRLGMREEGIARESCRIADRYLDMVIYATLEDQWHSRTKPAG